MATHQTRSITLAFVTEHFPASQSSPRYRSWWGLRSHFPTEAEGLYNKLTAAQQKMIQGQLTSSSSTDSIPKSTSSEPHKTNKFVFSADDYLSLYGILTHFSFFLSGGHLANHSCLIMPSVCQRDEVNCVLLFLC